MPPATGASEATPAGPAPEWEEVSLSDLVRTVYRRRAVLVTFLLVGILASVAFTVLTEPQYEAKAVLVPLENQDIITNWLQSRQAAELVVEDLGPRGAALLGMDPRAGSEALGSAMAGRVDVAASTRGGERLITLTATLPDPVGARDVAAAYLGTLEDLRPQLESITRTDTFVKFYDGSNAQEAQRRAEEVARQKEYWLVLDTPLVPSGPVRPQPVLNVTLGVALGLMLGILAVFGAEWLGKFRTELRGAEELALPPAVELPESAAVPAAVLDAPPAEPAAPPRPATVRAVPPTAPARAAIPAAGPGNGQSFTVVRRNAAPSGPAPAASPVPSAAEPATRFWKRRG